MAIEKTANELASDEAAGVDDAVDRVRCFGCMNVFGLNTIKVVQGIPICQRCEGRRQILVSPQGYEIEIVG